MPVLILEGLVSLHLLYTEMNPQLLKGRQCGYYPRCRVPLKCCHELHLMVNMFLIKLGLNFALF